jgi:isopentenyl-diphosphate delta-isomerase
MNQAKNKVTLINQADEVLGEMDKVEAHRGQGKLHRAISVFLFNKKGQVLVQQRSQYKIVAAEKWANTACGNVRPDESYLECAQRRLREELGIKDVKLDLVGKFRYSVEFENGFSERELDQVYLGQWQGELNPDPREVKKTDWIRLEEMKEQADQSDWAPWVFIIFEQKQILKKLRKYAKA